MNLDVGCIFLGDIGCYFVIFAGGKKPGSTDHQATSKTTNEDANTSMRGESVRSLERRERRELEAKEWPKLGATEEKEVITSHSTIDIHQVYMPRKYCSWYYECIMFEILGSTPA